MTFGPWSNYRLVLIVSAHFYIHDLTGTNYNFNNVVHLPFSSQFDWWKVETHGQFIATWLSVFVLTVSYHALRFVSTRLEVNLASRFSGSSIPAERNPSNIEMGQEESYLVSERSASGAVVYSPPQVHDKKQIFWLRLQHSALAGLSYMLALFLMLVAMTYNSSLFVALGLGYAAGDYLFFTRTASLNSNNLHVRSSSGGWLATKYSSGDCH